MHPALDHPGPSKTLDRTFGAPFIAPLLLAMSGHRRSRPSHKDRPTTTGQVPFLTLLLAPILLLAGCANPGPPKPPSLHLPQPATKLTAERVGNHITISWTVTTDTTDGGALRSPITARLCRDDAPKPPPASPQYPPPPDPCKTVQRLTVVPGPAHATDELPPSLITGAATLLAYRVELLNPRNRSAGLSAPVYAAAGAAPAPAGPIAVVTRRNGALLTWQPQPETTPMHVSRTLLATSAGPVEPPTPKKSSKSTKPSAPHSASGKETAQQLTLTPEKTDSNDPGGMIDRSIHDGDTLTYTAQRVHTVSFSIPAEPYTSKAGKPEQTKATNQTLELRGEPSPAVTFVFHDTLPPSIPTGLAAVPGGGFGQPPSIDLSWEPNPEQDILGYNVYRADASPQFTRINPEPIPGPAYRDLTAQPGHPYLYRITAIDQHHNESPPSQILPEQLHP
jgi:hypothetical protein